jgi:hypothetical protein
VNFGYVPVFGEVITCASFKDDGKCDSRNCIMKSLITCILHQILLGVIKSRRMR